jgi:hypothetical protein
MVKSKRSTSSRREQIELATMKLDQGLRALQALAQEYDEHGGVNGSTLSACCDQMAGAMLENVRALYDAADGQARHG